MKTIEKMKFKTKDNALENLKKIFELFPNCKTEYKENGQTKYKLNLEMFQQMLSNEVVKGGGEE